MASASNKPPCVKCSKALGHALCSGCQQSFCTKHFIEHRQEINVQLDQVTTAHDQLHQQLNEKDDHNTQYRVFHRIDAWEQKAIMKIHQVAEKARDDLRKLLSDEKNRLTIPLEELAKEIQSSRDLDDYTETEIKGWVGRLQTIQDQLERPCNHELIHDDDDMDETISIIEVTKDVRKKLYKKLRPTSTWKQDGITVASGVNQEHAFDVDDDGTIYLADSNHCIVAWKVGARTGQVIVGPYGHFRGLKDVIIDRMTNSLIISDVGSQVVTRCSLSQPHQRETLVSNVYCYGLAIDMIGDVYVCDWAAYAVRRYRSGEIEGIIVAGGNGPGNGFHQLDGPHAVFVDKDYSVYVSDHNNHRVMKWMKGAKQGIVVAGGYGPGNGMTQIYHPRGLYVDSMESVYVAAYGSHRVIRWLKGAKEGEVIVGSYNAGAGPYQLSAPTGLRFDGEGNLLIADSNNNRIQKFLLN